MTSKLIYLDNAATTFPKSKKVLDAMLQTYLQHGVSPGRGGYDLADQTGEIVQETRKKLAEFFEAPDPNRIIFSSNATDALNTIIHGLVEPNDHIIATRLEHNSVLRPLYHVSKSQGIHYDLTPFDGDGFVDPVEIKKRIKPNTKMVIVSHVSNVLGSIQPVEEIGQICRDRNILFIIDAAQSAGHIPVSMKETNASAIVFTGHKSLYGPAGIGGIAIHPELAIKTSRFGGTGIKSISKIHPQEFPYRLEAGTINTIGVFGLFYSLDFINKIGLSNISRNEALLMKRLKDGLSSIKNVHLYGPENLNHQTAILSITIKGKSPEDICAILDADYHIATRAGLHCSPLTHEGMGTGNTGAVRFSLGLFNAAEEIDTVLEAVSQIAR